MQTLGFFLSILIHAGVLAVALLVATSHPRPVNLDKPVYTVNIISLAPAGSAPKAIAKPVAKPAEPETPAEQPVKPIVESKPELKPEPKVEPKPAPDAKKISEKKKKPKKVVSKPKEKEVPKTKPAPKPKPKKSRKQLLAEALKDVKKNVQKQEKKERNALRSELAALRKREGDQLYAEGTDGDTLGDGTGTSGSGLSQTYASIVGEAIKKNWRYPALAGDSNLVATVDIELSRDGRIVSSRVVRSSGNAKFDSSILRAAHETERVTPPSSERDKRIRINFNSQEISE